MGLRASGGLKNPKPGPTLVEGGVEIVCLSLALIAIFGHFRVFIVALEALNLVYTWSDPPGILNM